MDLFELTAKINLDASSFASGLQSAAGLMQSFANSVLNFSKDVIQTGMGFDKQMSAVEAVLGKTEGTMENMSRLRAFALDQAHDSIFTAEQTGQAYYYMGMAGWKTEQMLAGLPGIMNLAAASGEDLGRVSDIVTDSLTAFHLGASDASRYVDILAQTATNANTDVSRMGETFKYLAPIAGSLGYSVEDVSLAIGLVANQGIKGSMAGTALRNVFTRLATNAGATSKQLGALEILTDRLGVQFYDAENNARPFIDVLRDVRGAWKGVGEDERNNIMSSVFGDTDPETALQDFNAAAVAVQNIENAAKFATKKEQEKADDSIFEMYKEYESLFAELGIEAAISGAQAADAFALASAKLGEMNDAERMEYSKIIASLRGMPAFLALVESGEEDFNKLYDSIQNAAGAAQDMADTRLDNLWGDTVKFNSALDVLKVAIFDDVKGPLREIVQYGTGAIDRLRAAVEEGGLTGGIEQLGTEIEAAGEKFAPMLESLGTALAPLMNSLFTQVLPLAEEAGAKLGAGLMRGIGNSLTGPGASPLMSLFGTVAGAGGTGFDILGTLAGAFRGSGETPNPAYAIENIHINGVDLPASEVQAAIDAATAAGDTTVTIAGVTMEVGGAQQLVDQVATDLGTVDTTGMVTQIGSAGTSAGSQVASAIASALSAASYSINVAAKVTGLPSGGGVEKNARAMNVGRIFNRPTVFGYANNAYQVAGDAGPEAVIGTNSLVHMIAEAVGSGMRAYAASAPATQSAPKPIVLQLNGRTVARAIVDDMDNALGTKAERRSTGRV